MLFLECSNDRGIEDMGENAYKQNTILMNCEEKYSFLK